MSSSNGFNNESNDMSGKGKAKGTFFNLSVLSEPGCAGSKVLNTYGDSDDDLMVPPRKSYNIPLGLTEEDKRRYNEELEADRKYPPDFPIRDLRLAARYGMGRKDMKKWFSMALVDIFPSRKDNDAPREINFNTEQVSTASDNPNGTSNTEQVSTASDNPNGTSNTEQVSVASDNPNGTSTTEQVSVASPHGSGSAFARGRPLSPLSENADEMPAGQPQAMINNNKKKTDKGTSDNSKGDGFEEYDPVRWEQAGNDNNNHEEKDDDDTSDNPEGDGFEEYDPVRWEQAGDGNNNQEKDNDGTADNYEGDGFEKYDPVRWELAGNGNSNLNRKKVKKVLTGFHDAGLTEEDIDNGTYGRPYRPVYSTNQASQPTHSGADSFTTPQHKTSPEHVQPPPHTSEPTNAPNDGTSSQEVIDPMVLDTYDQPTPEQPTESNNADLKHDEMMRSWVMRVINGQDDSTLPDTTEQPGLAEWMDVDNHQWNTTGFYNNEPYIPNTNPFSFDEVQFRRNAEALIADPPMPAAFGEALNPCDETNNEYFALMEAEEYFPPQEMLSGEVDNTVEEHFPPQGMMSGDIDNLVEEYEAQLEEQEQEQELGEEEQESGSENNAENNSETSSDAGSEYQHPDSDSDSDSDDDNDDDNNNNNNNNNNNAPVVDDLSGAGSAPVTTTAATTTQHPTWGTKHPDIQYSCTGQVINNPGAALPAATAAAATTTTNLEGRPSNPTPSAQPQRRGAWTEFEQDAAGRAMEWVLEKWGRDLVLDDKFKACAARMLEEDGVSRSWTALKAQYSRSIRARTGVDERARPKPHRMQTSVQQTGVRSRAELQAASDAAAAGKAADERVKAERKEKEKREKEERKKRQQQEQQQKQAGGRKRRRVVEDEGSEEADEEPPRRVKRARKTPRVPSPSLSGGDLPAAAGASGEGAASAAPNTQAQVAADEEMARRLQEEEAANSRPRRTRRR